MMYPKFIFEDVQRKVQQKPSNMIVRLPNHIQRGIQLHPQAQQVLLKSFCCLILGKPGAGKSHLISQLLGQQVFYFQRFDRILYIGPTQYQGCVHDEYNTKISIDIQWITQKLREVQGWGQHVLIVMDDIISQLTPQTKKKFQPLFFNRRHFLKGGSLSIIITSQKYTSVPTWIRNSLNQVFSFGISPSEAKSLLNQIPTGNTVIRQKLVNLKKHQFLYLNIQNGKVYDKYFRQN